MSNVCSSVGSSLMTVPEIFLKREQLAIVSSLDSSPHRLLQEQQITMSQCLSILPAIDPVNNMIVPHIRYSIPERFETFQLIMTHYKNEVQGKEIGRGTQ